MSNRSDPGRFSNCDKSFNLRIKLGANNRKNECVALSDDSSDMDSENSVNNNNNNRGTDKVDENTLVISREKSLIKDLNYCRVCKYKLSGRKHDNHFQTHRHQILEHFFDLCIEKGMEWNDMNARSFTCALHPDRFISSVEIMVKHCNRQHPDIVKQLNLPVSNIWKTRLENQIGKDAAELTNNSPDIIKPEDDDDDDGDDDDEEDDEEDDDDNDEERQNENVEENSKINKISTISNIIFACSKCSYRNAQRISVLKHIIQKHHLTAGMAGKYIIKTSKSLKTAATDKVKKEEIKVPLTSNDLDKYRIKGNMSVKCQQVMDSTLRHYQNLQPKNLQYVSNRLREEFIRFTKNQKKHNENGFYYCPTCKHKYPTVKSGKQHILRIAHSKNFFTEEYRSRYRITESYAIYNENNEFISFTPEVQINKRSSKDRSISSADDHVEIEKKKILPTVMPSLVKERPTYVRPKAKRPIQNNYSNPSLPSKISARDSERPNITDLNLGLLPMERRWMEAINDISALSLTDIGLVPIADKNRLFKCLEYIHSLSMKYTLKPPLTSLLNLFPTNSALASFPTNFENEVFKRPNSPNRLKVTADRGLRRLRRSPSFAAAWNEDDENVSCQTNGMLLNTFDAGITDLEDDILNINNSPPVKLVPGSNGVPIAQRIKMETDW